MARAWGDEIYERERDAVDDATPTLDRKIAAVNFRLHRISTISANVRPTFGIEPKMRSDGSVDLRRKGAISETDFNELLHYAAPRWRRP